MSLAWRASLVGEQGGAESLKDRLYASQKKQFVLRMLLPVGKILVAELPRSEKGPKVS